MTRQPRDDFGRAGTHGRERPLRGFRLNVLPEGGDSYGVLLEETNGDAMKPPVPVVHLDALRSRRVMASLLGAVKASGLPKSALSPARRKPLPLTEEAGVRLALVLVATAPIRRARRAEAMADAVEAMSVEEAYYWYARSIGTDAARIRRALRLFLAGD